MICPKCKETTEVLETTQRAAPVTRRRRRCLTCTHRFTTIEVQIEAHRVAVGGDLAAAVRRVTGRGFDAEAIAAAIAVDRRKAKIAREQRYRDEEEHAAPRRLGGLALRRELKGF